jgi:hypothetical protein
MASGGGGLALCFGTLALALLLCVQRGAKVIFAGGYSCSDRFKVSNVFYITIHHKG